MIESTVPKLIGLTGPAGCGKDTVGGLLQRCYGYKTFSFADPIRAACQMLFWIDDFRIRECKEMKIDWIGKSPRHLMQLLETEFGRHCVNPDIWIRHLQRRIDSARVIDPQSKFVITDIRFQNCADWVNDQCGEMWHIWRPCIPKVSRHASEEGVTFDPSYDRRLVNEGTIDDLENQIKGIMLDRPMSPHNGVAAEC